MKLDPLIFTELIHKIVWGNKQINFFVESIQQYNNKIIFWISRSRHCRLRDSEWNGKHLMRAELPKRNEISFIRMKQIENFNTSIWHRWKLEGKNFLNQWNHKIEFRTILCQHGTNECFFAKLNDSWNDPTQNVESLTKIKQSFNVFVAHLDANDCLNRLQKKKIEKNLNKTDLFCIPISVMIAGTAYGLLCQRNVFAFGVQLSGIPKPNPNKIVCVLSSIHLFDVFDSES